MSADTGAKLPRGLLIAFILPSLVLGMMHGPEGQIQAIYAKHAGLALTALAAAMLLTRMFDALTYPLIGVWSDRTYARTGSRRSWTVTGAMISSIGIWFLLRPPPGVGIVYFGAWMAVVYVGWKVIEIPLQAWSFELSADYAQRARVQAWRLFAMMIGQILFFAMPYLAVQVGASDSSELDFRSLGFGAVVCAVALPVATAVMVWRVPAGAPAPPAVRERFSVAQMIAAVRANPPLLRLVAAFAPVSIFGGLLTGVSYLYFDAYLGLSKHYPAIMGAALVMTWLGIPFWTALAARYERHRVWACSLLICGIAFALFALVSPGPYALPLTLLFYSVILLSLIGIVVVLTMVADIVDYGRFHTGEDHGGLYASVFTFLQKSVNSVATAAGVAIVGFFGFDATATTQTASGVFGIKLVGTILPAIGLLGSAAVVWNYPLNRARIAEIQAALKARDRAAPAA